MAALALATDKPAKELMERLPMGTDKYLVLEGTTRWYSIYLCFAVFYELNLRDLERINVFRGSQRNELFLGGYGGTSGQVCKYIAIKLEIMECVHWVCSHILAHKLGFQLKVSPYSAVQKGIANTGIALGAMASAFAHKR
ncbi:hypothetical protein DVH24_013386 [Malus domestica]|uniref:Uncharacterized protein n=1 Tax=Malus domestica TaxID=3750 RepID=A0A498HIW2_MALDO|nr:hypothetical protein DVH24_013386 [Malus domestica]